MIGIVTYMMDWILSKVTIGKQCTQHPLVWQNPFLQCLKLILWGRRDLSRNWHHYSTKDNKHWICIKLGSDSVNFKGNFSAELPRATVFFPRNCHEQQYFFRGIATSNGVFSAELPRATVFFPRNCHEQQCFFRGIAAEQLLFLQLPLLLSRGVKLKF